MEVYDRLAKSGIIVAAAAGNEYSAAYKNLWGTDLSLTSNPDYGIVGSRAPIPRPCPWRAPTT